jgi:DNA-binding NarL/FixJ family response regulator
MQALPTSQSRGALSGYTAVVCAADNELLLALEDALGGEDAAVIATAAEGHAGARLALDRRPDIVIAQAHLRDGIGGVEVAALILPQFETCFVVVGTIGAVEQERGERLGVSGFISESLPDEELISTIEQALRQFRRSILDQIH